MKIKLYLSIVITILLIGAGCNLLQSSVRNYREKEFNSADWKNGDAIERGRMFVDLYKKRLQLINGKSEKELVEMLGEPDQKQEKNSRQIWLYKLGFKYESLAKSLIITVHNGVSFYGNR